MSTSKHVPNPARLVEGKLGRLLEEANREFVGELDQRAAFQRVSERLSGSRRFWPARGYWLLPAMLLTLAGVVALPAIVSAVRRVQPNDAPVMVAEDPRGFRDQPAALASALAAAPNATSTPAERAGTRHAEGKNVLGAKSNAPGVSSATSPTGGSAVSSTSATPPSTALGVVPTPADIGAGPDCLSLARQGQTRQAEACFLKRAEGSGLGAEMALYEVARLRRDVLADAPGALAALAEYRSRFPAGSLRREADMSQLELLLQLGRSDEALQQSERLLSSSAAGERAAELRLLRGNILRKQSRFADAAREYELAESAGMRGGELTYFRALCLEALGRAPEAAALFTQYLTQPQRPYAEEARRHLQRMGL